MTLPPGRQITQWRKRLGVSATAFAAALGVNQSQVSRWENEKARPDITQRMILATHAGIPVDTWLNATEHAWLRRASSRMGRLHDASPR